MTPENQSPALSHLDASGSAQMVDVSGKPVSRREAIASGQVRMKAATLEAIEANNTPKGDVIATAKLAGIMAAKQTSQLIPLCHSLPLQQVSIEVEPDRALPGYQIRATAIATATTGVEMEALTAVSIAALTLYDMAKALDQEMSIEAICLQRKTGGRSGDYQRT